LFFLFPKPQSALFLLSSERSAQNPAQTLYKTNLHGEAGVADGHYSYHEQAEMAMAHACVGEHVFFLENTDFEMFLLSLSFLLFFLHCV